MPPSQHPVSQKQLAANRTNAAKQNARKQGFTAFAVVHLEQRPLHHLPNYLLGEGFHRMVKPPLPPAVEEFERLKALQQEIPNGPIPDPQPEPNETT